MVGISSSNQGALLVTFLGDIRMATVSRQDAELEGPLLFSNVDFLHWKRKRGNRTEG